MRNAILRVWNGEARRLRQILYVPLGLLSCLYRMGLSLRELTYRTGVMRTEKAPIPVLSIGNITLGGTGKTPVAERLSLRLKEQGFHPGIITRGYGRTKKGVFSVDIKKETAESAGDEAFMLARKTRIPVIVGKNRVRAIEQGIRSFHIDVAILDDGFQVRNLRKDFDLLLLAGKDAPGMSALFPLGPMREPANRMAAAHAILINKGEPDQETLAQVNNKPLFRVTYRAAHLYKMKKNLITRHDFLKGKRVTAFSGLGDNRSFFDLLRQIGAKVAHEISFPDHHRYGPADIKKCASFDDVHCIVTTEKDAVKIAPMEIPENLFYLSIDAAIEDEDRLIELMLKKIGGQPDGFFKTGIRGPDIIQ
ncbi:MAG TPA: tetraacyldisaccharide 4'-kinase [Syntrophorhabdaceae bacterium]|nr:tetraacyldisaccharide 4'-kinase [Syntrophorhabdaceae bacterium]